MLVTKTSLDVSVYFVSAIIPFRYYENVPNTGTKLSLFQEPKFLWLAHSIGDATQNIAKKKKRTLLDKITSLQKYKQEGLKQ